MSLALQQQLLHALERIKKLEDAKTDITERLVVLEKKEAERKKGLFGGTLSLGK
jgi:hypothetical protein